MKKDSPKLKVILTLLFIGLLGFCFIVSLNSTHNPFKASVYALVPSISAIILALITKEVYSSLFVGVLVGALFINDFNPLKALFTIVDKGFMAVLSNHENIYILIFLVLLGIISHMMAQSGGAKAFGRFSLKYIKGKVGASLMTIVMGIIIFIDDYFNCLTVGSIMRPVCDEHKISRAKLSYIIDATAAPICVLAPISSWAAAVAGFITGNDGFKVFVESIPYNFYAILTLVMLFGIVLMKVDYGSMLKFEEEAAQGKDESKLKDEEIEPSKEGKVIDLLFPVIILIVSCFIGLIYTGGFFDGKDLFTAFSNCDGGKGLVYGSFVSLMIIILFYQFRRTIPFNDLCSSVSEGFKSIVPAIVILVLAWSLKEMCDQLQVATFVKNLMIHYESSVIMLLPAIIFLISLFMAFATGSSWGTFGILIPIVLSMFHKPTDTMIICLSACMAGAVCGDHCSPISDTTIMAATGAKCYHIDHVVTQLGYVVPVAIVSTLLYILVSFIKNPYICLIIGTLLLIAFLAYKKRALRKMN